VTDLASRECTPCPGGVDPVTGADLAELERELGNDWKVVDEHHLTKTYRFPDFRQALEHTNRLGDLAEEVGHHPEITLGWGKVEVELYTHKIDGLAEADFVWAAKADRLLGD
jgi:4a-hydroxytetrahydrobiopterin dehydratase